jgi:hypothetical protein
MTARGGRITPDGRPSQAPGVGRNAKRHDLENPARATPPLHGSSGIQQGDIQALEQGQRMRPPQTQGQAAPPGVPGAQGGGGGAPGEVPDAIDFFGGGDALSMPPPLSDVAQERLDDWLPLLRELIMGPGSSGLLAGALINQYRIMRQTPATFQATWIDLEDVDDGLEAMLNAWDNQDALMEETEEAAPETAPEEEAPQEEDTDLGEV